MVETAELSHARCVSRIASVRCRALPRRGGRRRGGLHAGAASRWCCTEQTRAYESDAVIFATFHAGLQKVHACPSTGRVLFGRALSREEDSSKLERNFLNDFAENFSEKLNYFQRTPPFENRFGRRCWG